MPTVYDAERERERKKEEAKRAAYDADPRNWAPDWARKEYKEIIAQWRESEAYNKRNAAEYGYEYDNDQSLMPPIPTDEEVEAQLNCTGWRLQVLVWRDLEIEPCDLEHPGHGKWLRDQRRNLASGGCFSC